MTGLLIIVVVVQFFVHLRNQFKINYYEAKLLNRGVNIDRVKDMPIYKIWLN